MDSYSKPGYVVFDCGVTVPIHVCDRKRARRLRSDSALTMNEDYQVPPGGQVCLRLRRMCIGLTKLPGQERYVRPTEHLESLGLTGPEGPTAADAETQLFVAQPPSQWS